MIDKKSPRSVIGCEGFFNAVSLIQPTIVSCSAAILPVRRSDTNS